MSGRTYLETGGKKIRKIFLMTGDHDSGEIANATYDGGILHYDAVSNLHEVEIKEAYSYPGNRNVYTSAHDVYYHIDQNDVQIVEVDDGEDCIVNAPSATKSGWTFHGWREDTIASSTTISSKTCDSDDIHLYAVFKQTVTVTLYNNSATATTQTGSKYYNNGNIANPSFAPVVATVSGWSIRGWSTSSGASATITYNSGASFATGSNITLYASWSKTVTVSYNGNGSTSGSTANSTGTAYRNYKGDVTNASITLRANGYTRTGCTSINKWAMGSVSGTQYSVGASVTLSSNTTFYAKWKVNDAVITLTVDKIESNGDVWADYFNQDISVAISASLYSSVTVHVSGGFGTNFNNSQAWSYFDCGGGSMNYAYARNGYYDPHDAEFDTDVTVPFTLSSGNTVLKSRMVCDNGNMHGALYFSNLRATGRVV